MFTILLSTCVNSNIARTSQIFLYQFRVRVINRSPWEVTCVHPPLYRNRGWRGDRRGCRWHTSTTDPTQRGQASELEYLVASWNLCSSSSMSTSCIHYNVTSDITQYVKQRYGRSSKGTFNRLLHFNQWNKSIYTSAISSSRTNIRVDILYIHVYK